MRQRSRISPQVTTSGPNRIYTALPGGQVSQWAHLPVTYTPFYEAITDVGGPKWSGATHGRLGFKPCSHVRWDVEIKPYLTTPVYYNYYSGTSHGRMDNGPTGWRIQDILEYPGLDIYHGTDLGPWFVKEIEANIPSHSQSYYDRWKRVKPTMSSRASLAVSLFELGDIRRMFNVLPGKHFKLSDWRSVLRYANSQHLNYNFGWRPFVNDVKNVFRSLDTFDSRLEKFLSSQDTDLRRRAASPGEESTVTTVLDNGYGYAIRFTGNYTVTANSTFDYRYTLPEYGKGELRTRAYLDSLGLNITPGVIWEVVPWSFVVDWFTDVGGYLDAHSEDWIAPCVDFIQACDSSTVDCTATWALKDLEPDSRNVYEDVAVMHYHAFTRSLGIPAWTPSTDLDADKIRLLSSLAIGQIL